MGIHIFTLLSENYIQKNIQKLKNHSKIIQNCLQTLITTIGELWRMTFRELRLKNNIQRITIREQPSENYFQRIVFKKKFRGLYFTSFLAQERNQFIRNQDKFQKFEWADNVIKQRIEEICDRKGKYLLKRYFNFIYFWCFQRYSVLLTYLQL